MNQTERSKKTRLLMIQFVQSSQKSKELCGDGINQYGYYLLFAFCVFHFLCSACFALIPKNNSKNDIDKTNVR